VLRVDPALYELQDALRLPSPPLRIEALDVSHLHGSETVASLVVLWNARPRRSDYRRYRIRQQERGYFLLLDLGQYRAAL
jgi:excinuclease ABC subunit C